MIRWMVLLLLMLHCGPEPAAPSRVDGAAALPQSMGDLARWPRWRPFWL